MSRWRELAARIGGLLRRRRSESDLHDELQFHLEMMEAQLVREGMDREDARRTARARFGGTMQVAEAYREQQTLPMVETMMQDLRYGARVLVHNPGFTAVALLTLALAIGANAAIFSIVNRVLLRPLPFADPERLVMVGDRAEAGGVNNIGFATLKDLAERTRGFESMAAIRSWGPTLIADGAAEQVPAVRVGWRFFSLLGTRPALGRDFREDDDRPDRYRVLILSDGLWRRRFGADPSVIGRRVRMNDVDFEIVGVLPPGFEPLISQRFYQKAEMWAPLGYDVTLPYGCRSCQHLKAVGKLRPDVTHEQAIADLNAIRRQLVSDYPTEYGPGEMWIQPLQEAIAGQVRTPLLVLMAAVGFVLLIACANVANLLLARAVARTREMAVRSALGAGRGRLVRQVLTESTLLSLAGGLLGVALAVVVLGSVDVLAPVSLPRVEGLGVDMRVLAFTFLVSLSTGLAFGLVPALRVSSFRLASSMASDPRTSAGASVTGARRALVAADVALAVVLLAGAGLMLRTVAALMGSSAGFNSENVLTAQFSLGGDAYSQRAAVLQFQNRLLERVRGLPDVELAALAGQIPMGGNYDTFGFHIEGRSRPNPSEDPSAQRYSVTPDYFRLMQIPLVRGRLLDERDQAESQPVLVISESAAALWAGADPIGGRVRVGGADGPWRTVVGIVKDVHHKDLTVPPDAQMYLPQPQFTDSSLVLAVRGRQISAEALMPAIRQIVRELDPTVPISQVAMLDRLVEDSFADRRFVMQLLAGFALLAVLLAALGLYGVVASMVAERTREIGLRLALGATPSDVVRLVFGAGSSTVATGLLVGLVAARGLSRYLDAMVFGITPTDPLTFAATVVLLAAVSMAAHWIPMRRALGIDPAEALRQA